MKALIPGDELVGECEARHEAPLLQPEDACKAATEVDALHACKGHLQELPLCQQQAAVHRPQASASVCAILGQLASPWDLVCCAIQHAVHEEAMPEHIYTCKTFCKCSSVAQSVTAGMEAYQALCEALRAANPPLCPVGLLAHALDGLNAV